MSFSLFNKKKISSIFDSRIKSLLIYFYYTHKPRIINPLNYVVKLNELFAFKYIKKKKYLYDLIKDSIQKSNSTGVSFSDYRELYDVVKKKKPKNILELGSGISSIIMARALKENYSETNVKGLLETYEEDTFYFKQIKSISPKDQIEFVNFNLSKRITKKILNMKASMYESIKIKEYEFIFIDGPTLWSKNEKKIGEKTFNADILRVLSKIKKPPKLILLDKKIGTMWALQKCLPDTKFNYNFIKGLVRIDYKAGQRILQNG